jgi:hypothetical protein
VSEETAELCRGGPADGRTATVAISVRSIEVNHIDGRRHVYKRTNRRTASGHTAFEYKGRARE